MTVCWAMQHRIYDIVAILLNNFPAKNLLYRTTERNVYLQCHACTSHQNSSKVSTQTTAIIIVFSMSVLPHGKMDRTVFHLDWPPRDGAASWLLALEIIHLQASANCIINDYYETLEFLKRTSGALVGYPQYDDIMSRVATHTVAQAMTALWQDNSGIAHYRKKTVSDTQLSAADCYTSDTARSADPIRWLIKFPPNTHIYSQAVRSG